MALRFQEGKIPYMPTINPRQIIGAPAGTRNPIDILKIIKHIMSNRMKKIFETKSAKTDSASTRKAETLNIQVNNHRKICKEVWVALQN